MNSPLEIQQEIQKFNNRVIEDVIDYFKTHYILSIWILLLLCGLPPFVGYTVYQRTKNLDEDDEEDSCWKPRMGERIRKELKKMKKEEEAKKKNN